jgi:protein-disulfide isomerase
MKSLLFQLACCAILILGVPPDAPQGSQVVAPVSPAALQSEVDQLRDELRRLRRELARKGLIQDRENDAISIAGRPSIGDETAPIVVVEFTDFQCPYCIRHANTTLLQLRRQYVDTGVIQYVVKNLPLQELHPLSLRAAIAAECGFRQHKYWPLHDAMFSTSKRSPDPDRLAIESGLDRQAFDTCMNQSFAVAAVHSDMAEAERLGLDGTPTFVIGRRVGDGLSVQPEVMLSGAESIERFAAALRMVTR